MRCAWCCIGYSGPDDTQLLRCALVAGHEGDHDFKMYGEPMSINEGSSEIDLDDPSDEERCPDCGLTQCSGGCR